MIKLTIELDSENLCDFLKARVAKFGPLAHVMAIYECLPYHPGEYKAKIQFETEDTFLEFVQDWYYGD